MGLNLTVKDAVFLTSETSALLKPWQPYAHMWALWATFWSPENSLQNKGSIFQNLKRAAMKYFRIIFNTKSKTTKHLNYLLKPF